MPSEVDITKACSKCGKRKRLVDFSKSRRHKSGRGSWCKECINRNSAKWKKDNPDKSAASVRRFYWKHRAQCILKRRCYNVGITTKEYLEIFRLHNGKCDICGVSHLELNKGLCIDHNHETGKIRGLICDNCNKMLGHSKDNPIILENAITYLQKEFVNERI